MKKVSGIKYSVSSVRDYLFGGQFYGLHKKGFTLIELIVVMAIVSILASLLVVNFSDVNKKGRDSKRKSDVQALRTALELHRADAGYYPCSLSACDAPLVYNNGTTVNEYMKKTACDPRSGSPYHFVGVQHPTDSTKCSSYTIAACLENVNDSDENIDASYTTAGCSANQRPYVLTNP